MTPKHQYPKSWWIWGLRFRTIRSAVLVTLATMVYAQGAKSQVSWAKTVEEPELPLALSHFPPASELRALPQEPTPLTQIAQTEAVKPVEAMSQVTEDSEETEETEDSEKTEETEETEDSEETEETEETEESPAVPGIAPATTTSETQSPAVDNSEVIADPPPSPRAELEATGTATPTPTIKLIAPVDGTVIDIPAGTVIVQFPMNGRIELRVNGRLVDPSLIGRVETNQQTQLVTQTWYGVGFEMGENTLTVGGTLYNQPLAEVSAQVMVREAPAQLAIETVESRIPADGRSTATVRGQLIDKNGNRSNYTAMVTLNTNAGQFIGTDASPDAPGFQVEATNGEFQATLQAGTQAQTVRIQAQTNELEAFTQFQFDTQLRREPIVTGVLDFRLGARGTDYYDLRREFLPLDEDNSTELDISGAAFATGAIGDWQFTGAFNSDQAINRDCNCDNRLFGSYQDSENAYPVYGDSSTVEQTTPSIDSFYFRFERSTDEVNVSPDYFMWGDYHTEEFSTASQQFSATQRSLHGFKGNYTFGNLQLSAFYGNNVEGFQRDIIAPDGTRGYYFLSRRLLVPGSEDVFFELEELNRPGTVIRREELRRGADYQIDYDRGTILFNFPVLRTTVDDEGRVLVRRMVTTYQYESEGDDSSIYGGRLRYHLDRGLDQESWIGASYIQENNGTRDFELYGADAFISLGDSGQLIAEYAHSSNHSEMMGEVSGSAYRVEAIGNLTEDISGRAYFQSAETGFSNNATISFVPGQTRYGAEVDAALTPTTNLRLRYDHEDNEGVAPRSLLTFGDLINPRSEPVPGRAVDNSLTTISAGIQQQIGQANLTVDWIHRDREDRIAPESLAQSSDQIRSYLTVPLTDTLTLQALNEFTLSSEEDPVFSDRTLVGLDWEFHPGISLNLSQNWFTSGQLEGESITSLGVSGEYALGTDTMLTGRYGLVGGMNDMRGQGALGIKQGITLAPGLRVNLAYEHIFENQQTRTAAGGRFAQPFAVGQGASALGLTGGDSYSVGIEYTDNPDFKISAAFDHRSSSNGTNTTISAAASGKITPALTALINYRQASSANQTLDLGTTSDLRVGLAYRDPENDSFNALLRYEYRKNPSIIPETLLLGRGTGSEEHVFSTEAIYAPNWQWEFYGKFALRNSTTYLAEDFVGDSTITLSQLRATYRLGYNFDLVGEARWIYDLGSNYNEFGVLAEVGYYLTPDLRFSAGYAFGEADDRDFTGTRSAGGPYAGFTVKLNGLLDGFGL